MRTQFLTDLRCDACVRTITPLLDSNRQIRAWEADVTRPGKLLTVSWNGAAAPDVVITTLRSAGYTAELVSDDLPAASEPGDEAGAGRGADSGPASLVSIGRAVSPTREAPVGRQGQTSLGGPTWLARYKPLLIVFAYIAGGSLLIEWMSGGWDGMRATKNFMGLFFLGFAFFKLLDVPKFADAFATYDIVAQRSRAYALAYPWLELILGAMFVTGTGLVIANSVTALVMAIGLIGVTSAVRKKQPIQCACLGTVFDLPMSVVTIVENSLMLAMAVVMAIGLATQ